jgi:hypothetical protein
MTIITIYALIGEDIKLISCTKKCDAVFSNFNILAMALFGIELVLNSIAVTDYFLGFYFWLDFVSTLSILMDIE